MRSRYLEKVIQHDALADHKMAFISGPRQVGKTHLAKRLLKSPENYFNWDEASFRVKWAKDPIEAISPLGEGAVAFDEIHKYKFWKRSLKGFYDRIGEELRIIVTGSAKLDIYKKGGDSLLGRYIPYRLHPFSVGEREQTEPQSPEELEARTSSFSLDALLRYSGFPEPFLSASEQKANRWSRLRLEQLVRQDIRDLADIRHIDLVQLLAEMLPERVGSPLSIRSLHLDLQVAYATVRKWMSLLEHVFYCFKVEPYSKNIARSLTKESKYYLYDWIPVQKPGARLENLVAVHLLKACHFWTDLGFGKFELRYIRTKEKLEVDFCVVRDQKPWILVECKTNDTSLSKPLKKMSALFPEAKAFQLTQQKTEKIIPGTSIRLIPTEKFLSMLV